MSKKSNCDAARMKLEDFFKQHSNGCKIDSDCQGYYYRETCRGPVVLPKSVATPAFEKKLEEYKDKIQIKLACAQEWKNSPACSPIPAFPKCKSNQCLNETGDKTKL